MSFTIDDAFDEDSEDDVINMGVVNNKKTKVEQHSGDDDSLIQDHYDGTSRDFVDYSCLKHPKIKENWRMIFAAFVLLIVGFSLIVVGFVAFFHPQNALQGVVYTLTGMICFVPGFYHVIYVFLAARGKQGYHFHNLPLFT